MTPCYARPEIVLLHGMWCTGATLEPIARQFRAAGYMVHTPTLPLHKADLTSEERRRLGKVSMQDYAKYLRVYIQNLQLNQPPVLIGHSMGGLLAQMLATEIATRALLLISPAPAAGNNLIHMKSLTAASFILLNGRFWNKPNKPSQWHAEFCLFNQIPPEERQQYINKLVHESGRTFAEIVFWFLNKAKPTYIDLNRITCPVHVMAGGRDRLILPDVTRKAARDMANAKLTMYQRHGHMMYLEPGSDRTIQDMVSWVQQAVEQSMPAEIPSFVVPDLEKHSAAA